MSSKSLLYTIRNYYPNRNNTGIIVTLSAEKDNGEWQTIRAYIPFKSRFESSATSEILKELSGAHESVARITIPKQKKFDEEE